MYLYLVEKKFFLSLKSSSRMFYFIMNDTSYDFEVIFWNEMILKEGRLVGMM